MCDFFSFVTEPEKHGGKRFYFDWKQRQKMDNGQDSHSTICKHNKLNEDVCNKYEYNPLTQVFITDQINSETDDSIQAREWVEKLNWKKVVEPLIIKPIIHPLKNIPKVEQVTEQHIQWLKEWDSVRASVWDSVRNSVVASVRASVWDSVRDSVRDSVGASVWDSVRNSVMASVGAYISSFFDIKYDYDFSPCIKLWEI
jgi:hypothetical protein